MPESLFDKLSDGNWKELAKDVACLIYPVGTLVEYYTGYSKEFGMVSSISKLGKITIKCGTPPLVKVTGSNPGQGTFWHDPDISNFKIGPAYGGGEPYSMRFTPTYYYTDWKEKNLESPIKWIRENNQGLYKLKIEENGLVKNINYFQ